MNIERQIRPPAPFTSWREYCIHCMCEYESMCGEATEDIKDNEMAARAELGRLDSWKAWKATPVSPNNLEYFS